MFTDQQPTTVPVSDQQAALDAALASFSSHQPLQGEVSGSNFLGLPNDITIVDEQGEIESVQEQTEQGQEEATEETELTEEPTVSEGFAAEFKQAFGLEPAEAIETFNSLIAFRDEVRLMGEWNVTPSEYQGRMTQIREFYNSLPEEGREQFNSVEGASAIWNHLNKDKKPTNSTVVKPVSKTTSKPKNTKPTYKRSEINRMPYKDYRANLANINQAFLEGRIVEDV